MFHCPRGFPIKDASGDGGFGHQPSPCGPQGAEIVTDIREVKGLHHLSSPHLPQIVASRVTGAHYQWLPQYHPGLTGPDGSQHS